MSSPELSAVQRLVENWNYANGDITAETLVELLKGQGYIVPKAKIFSYLAHLDYVMDENGVWSQNSHNLYDIYRRKIDKIENIFKGGDKNNIDLVRAYNRLQNIIKEIKNIDKKEILFHNGQFQLLLKKISICCKLIDITAYKKEQKFISLTKILSDNDLSNLDLFESTYRKLTQLYQQVRNLVNYKNSSIPVEQHKNRTLLLARIKEFIKNFDYTGRKKLIEFVTIKKNINNNNTNKAYLIEHYQYIKNIRDDFHKLVQYAKENEQSAFKEQRQKAVIAIQNYTNDIDYACQIKCLEFYEIASKLIQKNAEPIKNQRLQKKMAALTEAVRSLCNHAQRNGKTGLYNARIEKFKLMKTILTNCKNNGLHNSTIDNKAVTQNIQNLLNEVCKIGKTDSKKHSAPSDSAKDEPKATKLYSVMGITDLEAIAIFVQQTKELGRLTVQGAIAAKDKTITWIHDQRRHEERTADQFVQNSKKAGVWVVKAGVKAITPPPFSIKTYGGGIMQSICTNGQGSIALSLFGAWLMPETMAKYSKVVDNMAPMMDTVLGDTYSRTAKITGGLGFATTARATAQYISASSFGQHYLPRLVTAGRLLTFPSLAAFGIYKVATYDPVGSTGKGEYDFAIEPMPHDQIDSPIDEAHVHHVRFLTHSTMLYLKQEYEQATKFKDNKIRHSSFGGHAPSQAGGSSSFIAENSDWNAPQQFNLDAKKAAYEEALAQELQNQANFERRIVMVNQFNQAYKDLQNQKDLILRQQACWEPNTSYVPPQAGVKASSFDKPQWYPAQQKDLEIKKERAERAQKELIADLGYVLDPATDNIFVIHMVDKIFMLKTGSWECYAKPKPSAIEKNHEKALVQQIKKTDALKAAYFKAQQAIDKCFVDGILVVNQTDHDQRVQSLKKAEKAYNKHLQDFLPGIISLTGQPTNILAEGSKTLVQGYDHTYTMACKKVNGLDSIETIVQRRDFTKPKLEGAVYNPTWGDQIKEMQTATKQTEAVLSLQRAENNILSMVVPITKPLKALTEMAQVAKGLLASK